MILSSFSAVNNTGWTILNTLYGQAPWPLQNYVVNDIGTVFNALDASSPYFFSFTPSLINPGLQVPVFRNAKPNTIAQVKSIFIRGGGPCGYNWATDLWYTYGTPGSNSPVCNVPIGGSYYAGYGSTRNATPILGDNPNIPTTHTTLAPVQIDLPYPIEVPVGHGLMVFLQDIPNAGQGLHITGNLIGRYVNT